MQSTDVVIAGGGLMGLTSAYYLAKRGMSVRLFDAGLPGRQASWAGGGILWPLYAWQYPEPVQALAQVGRGLFPGLCDDLHAATGIDPQYRECGLLMFDHSEADAARAWCADHNEPVEMVDKAWLGRRGLLAHDQALWLPKVGQVRNPRLCQALVAALEQAGVVIHAHEAVETAVTQSGSFQGVRSKQGFYPARLGVIAAGAWTSQIIPSVPVFPVKGQMLLLRGAPGQLYQILLSAGRYIIPRANGYILVGSTVEHAGYELATDVNTKAALQQHAAELVPNLGQHSILMHWAGLRPGTEDGVPYVGAVPDTENLYINAGHYRNGVVSAPASAQLLASIISGGDCTDGGLDVGAYSVARNKR